MERVIQAAAGVTFSILLTETGNGRLLKYPRRQYVYYYAFQFSPLGAVKRDSWGEAGPGNTSSLLERLHLMLRSNLVNVLGIPGPFYAYCYRIVLVKGLEGKKICQISCGHQHTVALDTAGWVLLY